MANKCHWERLGEVLSQSQGSKYCRDYKEEFVNIKLHMAKCIQINI